MICPYCRDEIESEQCSLLLCEGCHTPHHKECYEENGGCTLFGCGFAPPDEPKLSVNPLDFQDASPEIALVPARFGDAAAMVADSAAAPVVIAPPPPVPCATAQLESAGEQSGDMGPVSSVVPARVFATEAQVAGSDDYKNRMTYIMLALFLGALGAHNFYAGYKWRASLQLCLSVLTLGYGAVAVWLWAVIEVCTTEHDSLGRELN